MRRLTVLAVLAFDPPTCTRCMYYVPWTRTNYGDRSFSVNGPAACVEQSASWLACTDISIDNFKNQLKAFLFTTVYWLRICGLGEFSAIQMSLLLLLLLLLLIWRSGIWLADFIRCTIPKVKGGYGVFAGQKLCDPYLSASAVTQFTWGAIQMFGLYL